MSRTRFNDYTGQTIGSLFIEGIDKSVHKEVLWRTHCLDCGGYKITRGSTLGKAIKLLEEDKISHVSCGCHKRSKNGENHQNWKGCGDIGRCWYSHLKKVASKRNLEFTVTIDYLWDLFIKQNKKCALSGIEITISTPKNYHNSGTASLDRIDSSIGYIPGNVQWVDKKINMMKWSLSQKDFIDICAIVANYQKEKI